MRLERAKSAVYSNARTAGMGEDLNVTDNQYSIMVLVL